MSKDLSPQLRALADALLKWEGTARLGCTDVLVWWRADGLMIGFQGPALRIENLALRGTHNNKQHRLDISLQQALGHPYSVEYWPGTRQVQGVRSQFMDEGDELGTQGMFDGIESVVNDLVGQEDLTTCVLIPLEGSPWNVGDEKTEYYSAKKRKNLFGKAPGGLIDVNTHDETHVPGVHFCTIAPTMQVTYGGVVGIFRGKASKIGPWFATHSFDLGRRGPAGEAAAQIASCGGLLYPSLALGALPASVYGSCSLFARLPSVLQGLRPYKTKSRGPWSVVIYTTDAWTETTTTFSSDASHELFQQLTGGWWPDYSRFAHMYVLGPTISWEPGAFAEGDLKIASSTVQLASTLTKRVKAFRRNMTQADLENIRQTGNRFPYVEAKANAIMPMSPTFPLAACAEREYEAADMWLRSAGFKGSLLAVAQDAKEEKAMLEGKQWAQYAYSWRMRDVVLEAAGKVDGMVDEVLI